jgi:1-acyl-sn-glycerol-3-phosphate acyltransferase
VFVANHASYLDGFLLMAGLPSDVAFVAKREFVASFAIGRLLERLGCVFVERYDIHEATTGAREMQARLNAGESLAVFAEGTFRRDPGLLPFHMGAFSAATAAGAAVVPVAICGTRSMLPDGAVLPRPTAIEIIMGEPLSPEDTSWRTAVKLRRCARQHILGQVHEPDLEQSPAPAMA